MPAVRGVLRVGLVLMLLAGNAAIVQGLGWAGMLGNRVGEMGWRGAIASTFGGRAPCTLCRAAEALREPRDPTLPPGRSDLPSMLALVEAPPAPAGTGTMPTARRDRPVSERAPARLRTAPEPPPPRAA
jgi:hypothetical protein